MTEDEFIYTHDLGTIRSARATLRTILPENNELIDQKEFVNVMQTLRNWEMAHNRKIKVE